VATTQQTSQTFNTDHLHADLRGRSVRGGLLTLSSQGGQFVLQSVSTVVLAHLLTPADFGLVAMVTAITGLAQAFADLGLSEATIQHPEIDHQQITNLFWINTGIGLLLTCVTAAMAPLFVKFYHQPSLRQITYVVSITFLSGGLRVQHDALLKRQMRFAALAFRDVACYVVAVPVTIIMAYRGAGYWAIVALPLILNATQMVLSWVLVPWIPGLPRRSAKVRSLITFGGSVAGSYLAFTLTRSTDNVLIGWYWGANPLGLYSRAMNLLLLPVRQLGAPARSVAIPAFSRLHDDSERLARFFLRTANLIMWITAPIFGFLFVAATPVIVLTLGAKWREAAPVFQLLAIRALGQLLFEATIWLIVSRGESRRLLKLALVLSPITILSFVIGLPFGIKGVAFSGAIVSVAMLPWVLKFSFHGTALTLHRLSRSVILPVVTGLAGLGSAELALHLAPQDHTVSQLITTALAFAAGSALTLLVPAIRDEVGALWNLLRSRRSMATDPVMEAAS
jgi:O-antigen/teichoic acid export membrane protein